MSATIDQPNDSNAPGASSVTRTNPSPEDQATLSALLADLVRRHAPEGAAEEHWVGQMAMVMLRTRWADALEQRIVEAAVSGEAGKALPSGSVLVRWRARLEKDFCRAARELAVSQAERRTAGGSLAPHLPRAPRDADEAAFEAELARDPKAVIAKLLAQPDPFGDGGTSEPEPFVSSSPRGKDEPERPLNRRARRRRLAARRRAA